MIRDKRILTAEGRKTVIGSINGENLWNDAEDDDEEISTNPGLKTYMAIHGMAREHWLHLVEMGVITGPDDFTHNVFLKCYGVLQS